MPRAADTTSELSGTGRLNPMKPAEAILAVGILRRSAAAK
jgi:hypothetical protein